MEELCGGKYKILSELGRGGMGVVYKADQATLGRTVAIKALSKQLAENDQFLARFQQEARIVAKMGSHDNIVQVFDVEEHEGDYYIIMEFVEGASLGDRMKAGETFDLETSIRIVRQTARALHHAHKHDIVHRDIKPDNIMITNDGKSKVMDFGIACTQDSTVKTQTGLSIGTPQYMSPEQIEGSKNLDHRSDIYSLSIVLYYLAAGSLPFIDENPFALAMKHVSEAPTPPSTLNPVIDPMLDQIILTGMNKRPDDRYQGADIFEQELRTYMAQKMGLSSVGAADSDESYMDLTAQARAALAGSQAGNQRITPVPGSSTDPTMPRPVPPGTQPHYHNTQPAPGAYGTAPLPNVPQDAQTMATPVPGTVPNMQAAGGTAPMGGAAMSGTPGTAAIPGTHPDMNLQKKGGKGLLWVVVILVLLIVVPVGGYIAAPDPIRKLLADNNIPEPSFLDPLVAMVHGEQQGDPGTFTSGGTSSTSTGDESTTSRDLGSETTASSSGGDSATRVAVNTPAPKIEPDDEDILQLRAKLDQANYSTFNLDSIAGQVAVLRRTYPQSTKLRDFNTDLELRQSSAKNFAEFQTKIRALLRDENIHQAQQLFRSTSSAFTIEPPVNELKGEIDRALSRYSSSMETKLESAMQAAERRGNVREIDKLLEEIQQKVPGLPLARTYQAKRDEMKAKIDDLNLAKESAARLTQDYRAQLEANDFQKAKVSLDDLKRRFSDHVNVNSLEIDYREAIKAQVNQLYTQGLAANNKGNCDEAISLFERALKLDPDNLDVLNNKSIAERDCEEKLQFLNHISDGFDALKKNDISGARLAMTRAKNIDLNHPEVFRLDKAIDTAIEASKKPTKGPHITDDPVTITRRKKNAPKNMVYVPGGFYHIGSDDGPDDESPRQLVKVDGFYIAMFEVSVREYDEYLRNNARGKRKPPQLKGSQFDRPDFPVTHLTHTEAREYAAARGMRLPSEVEWEIAASTLDAYEYPTGNAFDPRKANSATSDRYDTLAAVTTRTFKDGTENANYPNGLRSTYSMSGNVSEWTASRYRPYPGSNHNATEYRYDNYYVVRGGNFRDKQASDFRSSRRQSTRETSRREDIGVRLAKDAF
jgi:serine/threonine protein kinase/formylglycine-generating enzyme required for sulfatase activity